MSQHISKDRKSGKIWAIASRILRDGYLISCIQIPAKEKSRFIMYKIRKNRAVFNTSARLDRSPGMLMKGEHFKPSQWGLRLEG